MNKKKIKKENIAKEINNEDIDYNEDYHLAKVPKDIVTLYNSLKNAAFGTDTTLQFDADGGVKKGELIETTSRLNIFSSCATMLICATLTPLTGGCSFGASLLCIMKMTAVAIVCAK